MVNEGEKKPVSEEERLMAINSNSKRDVHVEGGRRQSALDSSSESESESDSESESESESDEEGVVNQSAEEQEEVKDVKKPDDEKQSSAAAEEEDDDEELPSAEEEDVKKHEQPPSAEQEVEGKPDDEAAEEEEDDEESPPAEEEDEGKQGDERPSAEEEDVNKQDDEEQSAEEEEEEDEDEDEELSEEEVDSKTKRFKVAVAADSEEDAEDPKSGQVAKESLHVVEEEEEEEEGHNQVGKEWESASSNSNGKRTKPSISSSSSSKKHKSCGVVADSSEHEHEEKKNKNKNKKKKKRVGQRIWTHNEELILLKERVDFSIQGVKGVFYNFIKDESVKKYTQRKVMRKLSDLKRKYFILLEKNKAHWTPHEQSVFDLGSNIWGRPLNARASPPPPPPKPVVVTPPPPPKPVVVTTATSNHVPVPDFSIFGQAALSIGVDYKSLANLDINYASQLDQQWKQLLLDEHRLKLRRLELAAEECTMLADAFKSAPPAV